MAQLKPKTLAAIGRWGVMLPAVLIIGAGGIGKFAQADMWRDQFIGWGYPAWMSPVTGVVEILAAVLMLVPVSRFYGGILGAGVMVAAGITQAVAGAFGQVVPPLIAAFLAFVTAWWARPEFVENWVRRPTEE